MTILVHLQSCGVSQDRFFSDLAIKHFQSRHKKLISQIKIPEAKSKDPTLGGKKIEYDLAKKVVEITVKNFESLKRAKY